MIDSLLGTVLLQVNREFVGNITGTWSGLD
jgi:hypothetical protein